MPAIVIPVASIQTTRGDTTGIARDAVDAVLDYLGYRVEEWCRDTGEVLDISLPPEVPAAVLAACYAAAEAALSVQGSAAATLGRLGGKAKSPAKTAASAENGTQGGRPRAAVVAALVRVGRAIGCTGVDGDAKRIDQAVDEGHEAMDGEDQAEIDDAIQAARLALGGHRLHPGQHARKGELSAAVEELW